MSETDVVNHLRSELEIVNMEFVELLDRRQNLVTSIQKAKKNQNIWMPKREISLFKKYVSLNPSFSLNYDLMFSLLIETQASQCGDYPEWSNGIDLKKRSYDIYERINPILLFVRNRSKYQSLVLKDEYQIILGQILNE